MFPVWEFYNHSSSSSSSFTITLKATYRHVCLYLERVRSKLFLCCFWLFWCWLFSSNIMDIFLHSCRLCFQTFFFRNLRTSFWGIFERFALIKVWTISATLVTSVLSNKTGNHWSFVSKTALNGFPWKVFLDSVVTVCLWVAHSTTPRIWKENRWHVDTNIRVSMMNLPPCGARTLTAKSMNESSCDHEGGSSPAWMIFCCRLGTCDPPHHVTKQGKELT